MYLYGAGGHAKVIIDILRAEGKSVEALVDDNPDLTELYGLDVVHESKGLSPLIISIGNNAVRKKIAEKHGCAFACAVHPRATVSPSDMPSASRPPRASCSTSAS